MIEATIEHEPALRFAAFLGVFALVALWEAKAPRRVQRFQRGERWPHNLGLLALDGLLLRLLAPRRADRVWPSPREAHGLGPTAFARDPYLVDGCSLPSSRLDLAIYFQHVLFHAVPALWRLHRVHHSDPEFDVTTGTRFHPLEIVLSIGIKCVAVVALGAPALAVHDL